MEENIVLYSMEGCPKCRIIHQKLIDAGIKFIESRDVKVMQDKGIRSCPVLEVDGELLIFPEANKWVNERAK